MDTKAKILIVDDEPLILRSMQKTLLRAGYDVETGDNCTAGLELFEVAQESERPFDMALLDLNMPNFEGREASGAGLELLSRLLEVRPDLPVVVLSAYDEVNKAREAVTRGARNYCVKGREQSLLEMIEKVLSTSTPES
ncbi:MAG: response regulator [Ardenticatenales bacterium]|nr:response regulator [Ardenticatenales bacterium]